MKIRAKIFFGYLIVIAVAFYFFAKWNIQDIRRNYLESLEVGLIDTANLLASSLELDLDASGKINCDSLRETFTRTVRRKFAAQVYDFTKSSVDLAVYVTDDKGFVLFHSSDPRQTGANYWLWRDVNLTLRGEYGARSTRLDPNDPTSSILHIAAPVRNRQGKIVGALTVIKPVKFLSLFIYNARLKILIYTIVILIVVVICGLFISAWLARPVQRLTDYANAVRAGKKAKLPRLGGGEMAAMGKAFEEMRVVLEGKQYVENYVQNLTHELKSPLAGIRGAIELLDEENLTPEQQAKFIGNIRRECGRMQQIVDRMLMLSMLEARQELPNPEPVALDALVREVTAGYPATPEIAVATPGPVTVEGDKFLLFEAIDNLLKNAVEFSPADGKIELDLSLSGEACALVKVSDRGPGVPDYALGRVFEKFYSLPRPGTKAKSSGLGLSIVREIAKLHGGEVELDNRDGGGTEVRLRLPLSAP